jgi:hypothetical protein
MLSKSYVFGKVGVGDYTSALSSLLVAGGLVGLPNAFSLGVDTCHTLCYFGF